MAETATSPTTDINLRRISRDLVKRAKIAAATRELTLKDFVIDAIEKSLKNGGGVK